MGILPFNHVQNAVPIAMKLRLPSSLVHALLTTCAAALTSTPASADIPENYTPVVITNVDQLADYTESDYIAFIISSDITDGAYRMTGAHQYWTDDTQHTHVLTFEGIESDSGGGALFVDSELVAEHLQELSFSQTTSSSDGGAIYGWGSSTIVLNDNESVTFGENTASSGGAIYGGSSSAIKLNDNESVTFSGNCGDTGGAIYGGSSSTITLNDNESVTFSGNYSSHFGGAIYGGSSSTITLNDNESVTFGENIVSSWGGAIYFEGELNMTGNDTVSFINNGAIGSEGGAICCGAICTTGDMYMSNNKSVEFRANGAGWGGAIYNNGGVINITDNVTLTFAENLALWSGGAISCDGGSVGISGNGNVTFTGNSVDYDGPGGAIYGFSCNVIISGNESVTFSGNYSSYFGGAIYGISCNVIISGNESVTFSGNYEKISGEGLATYRLRSVFMEGGSLTLAAGNGQNITFYDTLYAGSPVKVSFNASYQDKEGVTRDASGDIVFSGKYAAEDLKALKADYTRQELVDSLTTEVYATTNLYGGRLRIEDGAIYKGKGINVAAGSNATLRLAGGTLDQAGYDVQLNAGTTLDLSGMNSITADALVMQDGSTLSFNLGREEGALLNLDAPLQTGALTVSLSGDLTSEHRLISLYDAAQYDTSLWTSGNVTVVGSEFDHLVWENGVLSYTPVAPKHITLNADMQVDDFGANTRIDIEGNGHKLTVKHPVDLVHLAMVDGTLQLAAGAGLNVGNIVSMVANGSADLEIAGDIEISDTKAYGKPGNKGTLSYVNMTTKGDYTIENMTITGSVIDVAEGTTLYLVNVDIKSDTHITDDPAWVFAQRAHVELNGTNTWVDQEITAAQDTLLYMCGDTQRSITMAVGSEIVELTSSMFDSVTLTGTDLWLDMTGIAEATYGKDFFTLDFQDFAREMAKAQVDVENLHVYATLDGERYTEAYSTSNGDLTTTLYFQVPEPTTSTLSLLALSALAAKRRRK